MFTLNCYITLLINGDDGITDYKISIRSPDPVMIFDKFPRVEKTVLGTH